jgi:hypothetical protein
VLRACCSVDTFRSSIRQFVLYYGADRRPPDPLPSLPGLLTIRRGPSDVRLIVANATDETRRTLRSLGADTVEELPVSFADGLTGYLDDRGVHGPFLGASMASDLARGAA